MDNFKNEIKKIVNKKVNDLKEILINLNDENIEILYKLVKKIFNFNNIESTTTELQILYICYKYSQGFNNVRNINNINNINQISNINNRGIILKLAKALEKIQSKQKLNITNKNDYKYIINFLKRNEILEKNKNNAIKYLITFINS
jgi:hypothetical protein